MHHYKNHGNQVEHGTEVLDMIEGFLQCPRNNTYCPLNLCLYLHRDKGEKRYT